MIPELLDRLTKEKWDEHREHGVWPDFFGNILVRALNLYGETVSPQQLWSWLQLASDGYHSVLRVEPQKAVRTWFSKQQMRTTELYQWWVKQQSDLGREIWSWGFWHVLCGPEIPQDLWVWQFSMAEAWTGEPKGIELLRAAVSATWQGADRPTLEEIFSWVEKNPTYEAPLHDLLKIDLPSHFLDAARLEKQSAQKKQELFDRERTISSLKDSLESIRSGGHFSGLAFLGSYFFASSKPENGGVVRIQQEFDQEIALAAATGFIAMLHRSGLPSPREIGTLAAANGRYYKICYPLMAGAILGHRSGHLPDLSCRGIQAALAHYFVNCTFSSMEARWVDSLIETEPLAVAAVLEAAWRPLLEKNSTHVPNLGYQAGQVFQLISFQLGLTLLGEFSRSRPHQLRTLMTLALAGGHNNELRTLAASQAASARGLRREVYTLWLALWILLDPDKSVPKVGPYISRGDAKKKAYLLTAYLESLDSRRKSLLSNLPSQQISILIKALGKVLPPESFPKDGWAGRHDPSDSARFVGGLIHMLGSRSEHQEAALLHALRDDRLLAAWRDNISNAVEQQRQKIREERYQRPSLQEALKILEGGEPTSLPDLHAIVCDQLRTLAEEIEKGSESGYQSFWNVKGHEELDSPVPENEARNRLRTRLNPKLMPLGISAEIEGHYTGNNRSDFKVVYRSMNIPVEIKKSDHRQVWTAPRNQLKAKYSIDPGARGFGVYLVFWFGADEGKGVPKPPAGVDQPSTAAELEAALRQLYSGEDWKDTEIICIDCSRRNKR